MDKSELITLIITTIRQEKYIQQFLISLCKQSYYPDELIVVNDNNPYYVDSIINYFFKRLIKLGVTCIYLKNQVNLGPAKSRNLAIKTAKGKILIFSDDDCILNSNWIFNLVSKYNQNKIKMKNLAGACGYTISDRNYLTGKYYTYMSVLNPSKFLGNNLVGANCLIDRTRIQGEIQFNEDFIKNTGEDLELSMRLYANGYRFIFIKDAVVYHRFQYNVGYFINSFIRYGEGRKQTEISFSKTGRNSNLKFNIPKYPRMKFIYPCILKDYVKISLHLVHMKIHLFDKLYIFFLHLIVRFSYNHGYRRFHK